MDALKNYTMNMETKDITQENIEKLKSLFPNCVTEVKDEKTGEVKHVIDFDVLKADLSSNVVDRERYEFTWSGKRDCIKEANKPTTNTLRPQLEKSVNFENTRNVYIEGDNLEALKILRDVYQGKVDMIYIDPPYNTGSDLVYNDTFKTSAEDFLKAQDEVDDEGKRLVANNSTDGKYHTNWLNMMYPRLLLAKDLLSEDGLILISINDYEDTNLKKICDEIFGEINFYGKFVQKKGNTQNDSKTIQRNHEYILCYSRNPIPLLLTYKNEVKHEVFEDSYYLGRDTSASSGHDTLIERANLGYTVYYFESTENGATGNHNTLIERANLLNKKYGNYKYYISKDGKKFIHAIAIKDYDEAKIKPDSTFSDVYNTNQELVSYGYNPIRPPLRKGNRLGCWTWGIETFKEYWNNNEALIKNKKNIFKKEFITDKDIKIERGRKYFIKDNTLPLQSIIDITNSKGTTELKGNSGLLPGCVFSNPKSTDLLKFLLQSYYKNEFTVMDFFAGSSTTADAAIQLNTSNSKNINFIMVQIQETINDQNFKNICELGEERIRRALIKNKDNEGFRVFKIDSTNMKNVFFNPDNYKVDNLFENADTAIKSDRSSLDLLFDAMLRMNISLDASIKENKIENYTYYVVNDNDLVACFEKNINEDVITELAKLQPLNIAFRDDSFNDDQTSVNCEQILKQLSPDTKINII